MALAKHVKIQKGINATEAVKFISICWRNKLVPMLHGSPGIGKSDIFHQLARQYKLFVIDLRLSQCDPTDLNGFPFMQGERAAYIPMNIWPLAGDTPPEGYNGWLILLDEITSAPLAVQASAYKVVLDRMVGMHKLHDRAVIACAGNKATDNAIVMRMSTAMQSRLIHQELLVDHKAWSIWASKNQLSSRVISYINSAPDALHQFDPNHNDFTFPSPRGWEFASRIDLDRSPMEDKLPALIGTVGEGQAIAYSIYTEVFHEIPTYADIKKDPKRIRITDEPAALAALAGVVGSNLTPSDVDHMMGWVYRIPVEFQVFTLRDAVNRTPALIDVPAVTDWLTTNARVFA